MTTFHSFEVKTLEGEPFDLSSLKGKKVMVVNTASECGFTPQYATLQEVYEKYKNQNFVIVGFPANEFGAQEPGSDSDIRHFCSSNYNVTFPMMAKSVVKGDGISPLYQWLTTKSGNGMKDAEVEWNFQKFLIDENGNWVDMLPPNEDPTSERIINWIEGGQ